MPAFEHGDVLLSQSGVILSYLSEFTGRFGGRDTYDQREVLRWMLFDNHRFTTFYQLTRKIVGLKQSPETPVTEFLRGKAIAALEKVERRLEDRPFIVGDYPTIADISMLGFQYYDEMTGIDMAPYRNIAEWKQRIASLPGWRAPYDNQLPRSLDWSNVCFGME